MQRSLDELDAGLRLIREAPRESGTLDLIVARPAVEQRRVLEVATLDERIGLVGDSWHVRPSTRTPDGSPQGERQVTIMCSRVIALIAGEREMWPLAGDQLYVDFDLATENIPPGSRLAIGPAVVEVTAVPHTGCAKFSARFGAAALRWANTPLGRSLNLRGIHVRVVSGGEIRRGDPIRRDA